MTPARWDWACCEMTENHVGHQLRVEREDHRRASWQKALPCSPQPSHASPHEERNSAAGRIPLVTTTKPKRPTVTRPSADHLSIKMSNGWGARIRTWVCRNQNPMPYHLATPQKRADHSRSMPTPQRPQSRSRTIHTTCGTSVERCRLPAATTRDTTSTEHRPVILAAAQL